MGVRLPYTPNTQIKNALHKYIWLRSRERASALKRDEYRCQYCGKKKSTAKGKKQAIEVHHLDGIEWENMIAYIRRHLLPDPKKLITLCPECHKREEACKIAEESGL